MLPEDVFVVAFDAKTAAADAQLALSITSKTGTPLVHAVVEGAAVKAEPVTI
ncbi:hypothetical protein ACEN9F_13175 [Duganella sp. CT11-25]|uniref:hypothetical protein n=1 Tax=unclassified Duganella TaxID=2636909 RepID=UPI0039AF6F5F